MSTDPWLKFYPTDWRADPALRMCSMAARGLWIEMIALMHDAVPYGHLLVSGRSPTGAQLAVLVGAPPDQIPGLLGELEAAGVFSRTRESVIYSRKMTRAAKKAAIARKNGCKGGNPNLCNGDDNPPSDKGQDKGRDKPQKPEARKPELPEAKASGRDASDDPSDEDFAKSLFNRAVAFLGRHGTSERQARSVVGKWRKSYADTDIFAAFNACSQAGAIDPIPWIAARLSTGNANVTPFPSIGGPNVPPRQSREAADADAFRRRHLAAATARRAPAPDFSDG